jgi:hypothetical protein
LPRDEALTGRRRRGRLAPELGQGVIEIIKKQ